MAYKNKTYIAFDGDNDMNYYSLMKAWKQSDCTDFNFYDAHELNYAHDWATTESIKEQLRKRMANSKIFVLLLGERTKYLTRFVKWEVEHAIYLRLPIIVVNLNGRRDVDSARMPNWLDNYCCICCSYNSKILQYSLENWPAFHERYINDSNYRSSHRVWRQFVYFNLGI